MSSTLSDQDQAILLSHKSAPTQLQQQQNKIHETTISQVDPNKLAEENNTNNNNEGLLDKLSNAAESVIEKIKEKLPETNNNKQLRVAIEYYRLSYLI
jgi:phosphomannomutase